VRQLAAALGLRRLAAAGPIHPIEIVRHSNLACEKAETLRSNCHIDRAHLDERLPCLGNHKWLAVGGAIDEPEELFLRFVNVDRDHPIMMIRNDDGVSIQSAEPLAWPMA